MFNNKLKRALKKGESKIGTFSMMNSPAVVELIALAGFDFVIIDTEHGPGSIEETAHLIRAAEAKGITPLVRVTENSTTTILRNLDIGIHGIQVPQVNSEVEAKKVVDASKYHPMGNRGVALSRAGDYGYGTDPTAYFEASNKETMVVVQCESTESLNRIEAIAQTPGLDVIFFGPFDMSQSMGIPGKVRSEQVEAAALKVLETCKRNGLAAGIFVTDGDQALERKAQGFQYVVLGMESTLFLKGLKAELAVVK